MENTWVWIVGIVAAAAVLSLAVWLNRGLKFKKDQDGISLELDGESAGGQAPQSKVSVGDNLKVAEGGEVGNVTGTDSDSDSNVDVLSGAEISGKVGDITGKSVKDKT